MTSRRKVFARSKRVENELVPGTRGWRTNEKKGGPRKEGCIRVKIQGRRVEKKRTFEGST